MLGTTNTNNVISENDKKKHETIIFKNFSKTILKEEILKFLESSI